MKLKRSAERSRTGSSFGITPSSPVTSMRSERVGQKVEDAQDLRWADNCAGLWFVADLPAFRTKESA
jgi:hypothetical protein